MASNRRALENARARREIKHWAEVETPEDHLEFVKGLAVDVLVEAKRRTRVRTGKLQRAWTISLDDKAVGTTGRAALSAAAPFRPLFVVNPEFYASWQEFGTARQAGRPMLRPAIAKVARRVEKAHGRSVGA